VGGMACVITWRFFDAKELHKLSLVDATSFALMHKHKIRVAFTFDIHFAVAGFRLAD
jgi:predicted nucleic acid-binding protein